MKKIVLMLMLVISTFGFANKVEKTYYANARNDYRISGNPTVEAIVIRTSGVPSSGYVIIDGSYVGILDISLEDGPIIFKTNKVNKLPNVNNREIIAWMDVDQYLEFVNNILENGYTYIEYNDVRNNIRKFFPNMKSNGKKSKKKKAA